MTKKPLKTVEEYVAAQPATAGRVLKKLRSVIRKAVPAAEESLSYGIPTYKVKGRPVIYFAGWKEHYSIYPSNSRLVATFRDELEPYEVEKGTIRFPLTEPVPATLIAGIAKFRLKEASESSPTRARRPKR
jgi:uncharacterized protein YdhG (YjbR/CyaY superfamily)